MPTPKSSSTNFTNSSKTTEKPSPSGSILAFSLPTLSSTTNPLLPLPGTLQTSSTASDSQGPKTIIGFIRTDSNGNPVKLLQLAALMAKWFIWFPKTLPKSVSSNKTIKINGKGLLIVHSAKKSTVSLTLVLYVWENHYKTKLFLRLLNIKTLTGLNLLAFHFAIKMENGKFMT